MTATPAGKVTGSDTVVPVPVTVIGGGGGARVGTGGIVGVGPAGVSAIVGGTSVGSAVAGWVARDSPVDVGSTRDAVVASVGDSAIAVGPPIDRVAVPVGLTASVEGSPPPPPHPANIKPNTMNALAVALRISRLDTCPLLSAGQETTRTYCIRWLSPCGQSRESVEIRWR